ncbi:MAG TPA: Ku protein [Bryobacteraceae bacterium]|nr:Ku protein [Bryobacteraceae bacterium]
MPSIIWKGQLTFGLVSIPVKLYRAARRERVQLHYVHQEEAPESSNEAQEVPEAPAHETAFNASSWRYPDAEPVVPVPRSDEEPESEPAPLPPPVTRVKQSLVTTGEEQPVRRSELLRGYEIEPDRYVVLDPGELKGLRKKTSAEMEIVRSVRLSEVDPVFFETSYYVVPAQGGQKAYALLFAALQATGHVALARVGMHGREHVVIIRPGQHGMLAHTMFYTDEIRFDNEYRADVQSVGKKELELARTFLEALEAPFAPEEFKDTYREELQAIIARKQASVSVGAPALPAGGAPPPGADILEALRKSIELKRKPVASETQPAPEPKRRRQPRKAAK